MWWRQNIGLSDSLFYLMIFNVVYSIHILLRNDVLWVKWLDIDIQINHIVLAYIFLYNG